jgi:transposase
LLFLGDDWAEDHHDVEIQDETGRKLATARLPEGVEGIARLHELIARHGDPDIEAGQVVVGIETDRGPWVQALIGSGYQVFAINPRQVNRFKDRYGTSGAKATRATRTRWPIWSASTGPNCAPWPATASRPRRSRSSPARTRR